jgi:hypothetical protein
MYSPSLKQHVQSLTKTTYTVPYGFLCSVWCYETFRGCGKTLDEMPNAMKLILAASPVCIYHNNVWAKTWWRDSWCYIIVNNMYSPSLKQHVQSLTETTCTVSHWNNMYSPSLKQHVQSLTKTACTVVSVMDCTCCFSEGLYMVFQWGTVHVVSVS